MRSSEAVTACDRSVLLAYSAPAPIPTDRKKEPCVNKQDLVEAVAKSLGKSKAEAAKIVEALFAPGGVICSELKKGRKVQITGFGNFETRKRKARTGRNPRTGRAISIKAGVAPVFRAGKGLKELVNKR
jgi:DNA-binding protein HU-beta